MLWDIRALMKPALSVIDMIPDVHRTPALALLRRTVLDGRPLKLKLSPEDKELAFHDASTQLTSPLGARILLQLYKEGHIKLKKPAQKSLPTLEAYIATEPAFRAKVEEIRAREEARLDRLAAIIADPSLAQPDELTVQLVDKVMNRHLGHGVWGQLQIGGLLCHRSLERTAAQENLGLRAEGRVVIYWLDAEGNRQGDPA